MWLAESIVETNQSMSIQDKKTYTMKIVLL
jgi:hypothetical protein